MKQIPLVSIALCTYNGVDYLAEQLDTLVNQSYRHIEIIAVDDCSTDETFSVLTAYAAKYPQFKLYQNEKNLGFIANFEKAVKLCNGELIALCDQDDLWNLQKIELQVNAIAGNVFIYHDSEFVNEDGTTMNKKMSDLMNLYRGDDPLTFLFLNCVSGHTILMKKSLLSFALPLKKEYFHDWWLAYVATNIGSIDFIPQCLVKYRQHRKNETNILKLDGGHHNSRMAPINTYEKILNWLQYCNSFKYNRDKALINRIYTAYKKRAGTFLSFEYCGLLFKLRKAILFISKKSAISKLNFIRKEARGFKAAKEKK
jgi:glycosyltransferase involved in cell wall biosynthesis